MRASDDEILDGIAGATRRAETLERERPVDLIAGLALVAATGLVVLGTLVRVVVALVVPGRAQLLALFAGPDPIDLEPRILRRH